jgi:hypothetical protein
MTELSPIGTMSSVPYGSITYEQQIQLKLKQGTPIYGVEMKVRLPASVRQHHL